MLSSLTQETATRLEKKYSFEEGRQEGRQEGIQSILSILKLFKSGAVSLVDAAKALNMTQEEFKELVR